jgi:signal transduction histidine kinase
MRNVDRLGRLINDVLDYQKLEAQQMEFRMKEQSINGLIEEVAKGFKIILENKGVNLQLQLELSLPNINLDRDKITQVLTNLISNAMKFTDKGSIILRTQMQGHNAIKVSVQDQGIGIKPEDMDKLFKSFSQISIGSDRQTGGTGLGLILCKKIIQNHHGRVGVDSIFGQGSTFYFIIPIREKRIV